ncbi:MAG: helix-turn-helix domain-containing protein [Limisphaerales bacterium]
MNTDKNETIGVAINGQFVIRRDDLERLLQAVMSAQQPLTTGKLEATQLSGAGAGGVARLAFTMRETAEVLGVSYITVHRLLQRGLLRSSGAVRHKIIARTEIERFLKETSRPSWE